MSLEAILQMGILNTLSFFSLFGKRLTLEELLQYFYIQKEKTELHVMLMTKEEELKKMLPEVLAGMKQVILEDGKYRLKKGEYGFDEETTKELNDRLIRKCTKYISLLRHIPYIRMVGVGNTLAFGSADTDSDIDLFIIAERGHVWLVRFLVGIFYQMLGVRRYGKKVSERFCLSFYVDTSVLDFRPIMLQPDDVYMRFWVATMKPFLGVAGYEEYTKENTDMLKESFPFWRDNAEQMFLSQKNTSMISSAMEKIFNTTLGQKIEGMLVKLQKKKMEVLPVHLTEEASVVVSDHMLKFHNKDRRKKYREEWEQMIGHL